MVVYDYNIVVFKTSTNHTHKVIQNIAVNRNVI